MHKRGLATKDTYTCSQQLNIKGLPGHAGINVIAPPRNNETHIHTAQRCRTQRLKNRTRRNKISRGNQHLMLSRGNRHKDNIRDSTHFIRRATVQQSHGRAARRILMTKIAFFQTAVRALPRHEIPVPHEGVLQLQNNWPTHPEMIIPHRTRTRLLSINVHPTEKCHAPIHNERFAMIAQVNLKLTLQRIRLRPTHYLHVRNASIPPEQAAELSKRRPEPIVQHPHLNAFPRFRRQRLHKLAAHSVVGKNECLQVDVMLRITNSRQHGWIGLTLPHKWLNAVTVQQGKITNNRIHRAIKATAERIGRLSLDHVIHRTPVRQGKLSLLLLATGLKKATVMHRLDPALGRQTVNAERKVEQRPKKRKRPGNKNPQ